MDDKCWNCPLKKGTREGHFSNGEYQELVQLLEERNIRTLFQPIISLRDGRVLGYEGLSRGPRGHNLETPSVLFAAGEKYNKVWELELLCRVKALEKAACMPEGKLLFLNVDPKIIYDERFQKGITKEMLREHPVGADRIVFEITEKTAVDDYRNFRRVLENYKSQGYQIAIDDMGSGWSGLKMLTEICPQYIKIDMDLIRDIDKDAVKQALMKAFCDFARITDRNIIAEGIETEGELDFLISVGVPYGQGYFLQRPAEGFTTVSAETQQRILQKGHKLWGRLAVPSLKKLAGAF